MPFEIVRNDIANMEVDVIVTTASQKPVITSGVDAAVHKKAGAKLLAARQKLGLLQVGDTRITNGYDLPAHYVIHALTPIWANGAQGEEQTLFDVYISCLRLAYNNSCESIAFPLLGAGNHGFAPSLALKIAIDAITYFLSRHEMLVYLVVYKKESLAVSQKLIADVKSFIDDNYVKLQEADLGYPVESNVYQTRRVMAAACRTPSQELGDFLKMQDASFSQALMSLIEQSGKKASDVWKKANVDKKLFSKIKNNPDYHPSKKTAVAFAIALQLDLSQTLELIGRAGYTLTRSSRFDLIIEYFIAHKNYNVFEINEVLFELDEVLLGS